MRAFTNEELENEIGLLESGCSVYDKALAHALKNLHERIQKLEESA